MSIEQLGLDVFDWTEGSNISNTVRGALTKAYNITTSQPCPKPMQTSAKHVQCWSDYSALSASSITAHANWQWALLEWGKWNQSSPSFQSCCIRSWEAVDIYTLMMAAVEACYEAMTFFAILMTGFWFSVLPLPPQTIGLTSTFRPTNLSSNNIIYHRVFRQSFLDFHSVPTSCFWQLSCNQHRKHVVSSIADCTDGLNAVLVH